MHVTPARKITTFDDTIKHAHSVFLLPYDYRLLKAQFVAESRLNPSAKSPAGAMGIAQFMPETWLEMLTKLIMPRDTSAYNAGASIRCGAFYMASLIKQWSAPRPEIDRYCLALASYNAGLGNLLKAQKLSGGCNEYHRIIAELHRVTGEDNAKETTDYVTRILSEWHLMILEG